MEKCWRILALSVVLLIEMHVVGAESKHGYSTSVPPDIVELLQNGSLYNRHASPTQDMDIPTQVNISMYIEGISSFKAQTMDFQVDVYFQERWVDQRLRHNQTKRVLIKDMALFELMWHPDLYFANAKLASFYHVTAPNYLVWIYNDGSIYYDCRISLTVMCMQNLAKYPLDRQSCSLRILSYAYDVDQLVIQWERVDPIEKNSEITMADMHLISITPGIQIDKYATGSWSCATAEFSVRREIMHHVLQSYMPTGLIVVISWLSFWLDVDAVPGRVSLSITTLLTLATQANAARFALPQVSYIKAIDTWMGTCMGFVFGVMIEFTFVNYWTRRKSPVFPSCTCSIGGKLKHMYGGKTNGRQQAPRCCQTWDRQVVSEMDATRPGRYNDSRSAAFDPRLAYETTSSSPFLHPRTASPLGSSTLVHRDVRGVEFLAVDNGSAANNNSAASPRPSALVNDEYAELRSNLRTLHSQRRWKNRKIAQSIDQKSRWLFPFAFTVFNIVYWIYYLFIA